jgi:glucosyl-3-phosphoglycerate synthase
MTIKPFQLMLVLNNRVELASWVTFAAKLLPAEGHDHEIHLRGLVSMEADKSLSEGALAAREWRDSLNQMALEHDLVHDEVLVHVDYQPFQRILEELNQRTIDLLVVEWSAALGLAGGMAIEDVLQATPCSLVLVSDIQTVQSAQNVLLALRGGPNLSIGTHVAAALAGEGSITLFHAVNRASEAPDLEAVMRAMPQISRSITAVAGIVDGIVRESGGHDVIVMGAGMRRVAAPSSKLDVFKSVYERSGKPIVLVNAAQQEALNFHAPRFFAPQEESPTVRVDRWFAENTYHSSEFSDLRGLLALKEKQGVTISVALPALNEEKTIGNVIATLKTALMDELPLVDELVLIDSASTDRTVEIASEFGIPIYVHQQILHEEVGAHRGKGEALWKSLYVTRGDIIAWVDTDITNIHPRFIYGLLGPLLKNQRLQYVKGFYARPIAVGDKLQAYGGGRVTELVARPLLNLFYPELSGIIQPLSGEYAGRRAALEQVPFFSGYGVETGMLIDIWQRYGLESIAQSDLEVRVHHNQPLVNLSKMSFAILQVFIERLEGRYGVELLNKANRSMKLVIQEPGRFALDVAEIGDRERPPMISLPAYQALRRAIGG